MDSSSFMFYTVAADYDGADFELQDKMQRCVFAYEKGKLYQGRVYPDGRDGGDKSLSSQFRAVVQKIIAEALGVNNLWKVKKGTESCGRLMTSMSGRAYKDWLNYDDCNVSINEEIPGWDVGTIHLNAKPVCVNCGDTHTLEDSIVCENCRDDDGYTCDHCGRWIPDYEGITVDGRHYCCSDCAEDAGYRWCEDVDEWHDEDECHFDNYDEIWFYDEDDMVETEDNHLYRCRENAEADGYAQDWYTDEWWPDDECCEDYDGHMIHVDRDTVRTADDEVFRDAETAEENGYQLDDNGDWVKGDE